MKLPEGFGAAGKSYRPAYDVYRKAVMGGCIVISVVCAAVALATAIKAGPIWDDPTTIRMMGALVKIQTQPELSYEAAKILIEKEGDKGAGFYGAVTQFSAHWLETVATGASWLKVTWSLTAIMWRHIVCFGFTICSILALLLTVRTISRSWLFANIVTAVLFSTPVFLGLSVIDEKDAPIGAGMTLLSCGTALLLWGLFKKDDGSWRPGLMPTRATTNAVAGFFIFFGTTIAFGTRVGAIALIVVECAVVGFLFLLALPKGVARVVTAFAVLLLSAGAGVFLATVVNPLARKAPIQWILEGTLYATRPATQALKLYGETVFSGSLPWWYIPAWIVAEYPVTFLALVALGLIAFFLRGRRPVHEAYPWAPFVVQGLVLPICIVVSGAVLHDRLRHLIFIIPPLAILAAFGLYYCVDAVRVNRHRIAILLGVLGPLFLLVNFALTLTWYPYQYAYLNEIARSYPQYAFDNEPLGLSINEAVARMRQLGVKQLYAGPAPIYEAHGTGTRAGVSDGSDVSVILLHPNHPHEQPVTGGGTYYVHTRPSWGYAGLPAFCRRLFTIERQGVILGAAGEC